MKLKLPAIKTEYSIKRIHFTAENLYLLVYALYSFFYIFNHSTLNIEIVSKAVKGLTILVLGMLFAALDYTDVKKLIARVMVLLLFAVTAFTNGSLVFLCSGLLLTCACLTNFRKICKALKRYINEGCRGNTGRSFIMRYFHDRNKEPTFPRLMLSHLHIYPNLL